MRIFCDIDGTICKTEGNDYQNAKPDYTAIAEINKLHDASHEIVYWTARGTSSGRDWQFLTLTQLDRWKCRYTKLRMGKPSFDFYLDQERAGNMEQLKNLLK
jgi:hypothetical protein